MQVRRVKGRVHITDISASKANAIYRKYRLTNPKYTGALMGRRTVFGIPKHLYFSERTKTGVAVPIPCWKGDLPFTEPQEISFPRPRLKLIDYQHRALLRWQAQPHGMMCAPAGSGKTVVACGMLRLKRCRTVILVGTKFLVNQWAERILEFAGVSVGKMTGDVCEPSADIVVATMQTAIEKRECLENRGMIMIDECHQAPCMTMRTLLGDCGAYYRYGMTATPKRSDGLHDALPWLFGGITAEVPRSAVASKVVAPEIVRRDTGLSFSTKRLKGAKCNGYQSMHENVAYSTPRNNLIVKAIEGAVRIGHTVIALGLRVHHLQDVAMNVRSPYAIVTGTTPAAERDKIFAGLQAGRIRVLLATYQLAAQALDIPRLSCLVQMAPIKNEVQVEQSVGRISRVFEGKPRPVVVDLRDGGLGDLSRKRDAVYASLGL